MKTPEEMKAEQAYKAELVEIYKANPPHCTCTVDKEMTCIVHPTPRSMKERIAELEAENQRLKQAAQRRVDCGHDDECGGRHKDRCGCGHTELENALEALYESS